VAPAIVLHFHPGWKHGRGSVVDAIVADGAYRSQWLTGTSSGGLTAHLGGQRWGWEQRLFAGRYDHSDPAERPVYGAWNRRDDPYGHAPAFAALGCPVMTHDGYRVRADEIDVAYRGEVPVALARRLGGEITPARLGAAQRSGDHDPQAVKWLWHCLARFGRHDDPIG